MRKLQVISCVLWKMEKANVKGFLGQLHLLEGLLCNTLTFHRLIKEREVCLCAELLLALCFCFVV